MFALIRSVIYVVILFPSMVLGADALSTPEGANLIKPGKEVTVLKTFNADVIHTYEVLLHWTTKIEHRNAFFKIEKSKDLIDFELVGKISSKGNGNNQHYQILDTGLEPGTYYYRLSHQDKNGKKHMLIYMSVHVKGAHPSLVINEMPIDPMQENGLETELADAGLVYLLPGKK
jgi:hypothetical protein